MEDAEEISSESNVVVDRISDFPRSRHQLNNSAIPMTLQTTTNAFNSKIGFNLYPMSMGRFTIIIEWYKNYLIDDQFTITAGNMRLDYTKILIAPETAYSDAFYMIRIKLDTIRNLAPQYLFLQTQGQIRNNNKTAHVIIYGIGGYHDWVNPMVFDNPFILENQKKKVQGNLDINSHILLNAKIGNNLNMNGKTTYNLPTTGNITDNMALSWHQIKELADYVLDYCIFRLTPKGKGLGNIPGTNINYQMPGLHYNISQVRLFPSD